MFFLVLGCSNGRDYTSNENYISKKRIKNQDFFVQQSRIAHHLNIPLRELVIN